jgi:DNA modification methylase
MLENKIYNLDVLEGLKQISDKSADIIIIDSPYNIKKRMGNCMDNMDLLDYIAWSKEWINESIRIMKDTSTMYIFGSPEIIPYLFVEILLPKRMLIWSYTNKNTPRFNFWQKSYESIILIHKGNPIFNLEDIREKYTDLYLKNIGKKRKSTKGRFSNTTKETFYKDYGGALPRSVLNFPALSGGAGRRERFFLCKNCNDIFSLSQRKNHTDHETIIHETQKPYKLIEKLVKASKIEGGLLVSPFSGTGIDSYVGKKLEMNTIAFDTNPDYVKLGELLLEKGHPTI